MTQRRRQGRRLKVRYLYTKCLFIYVCTRSAATVVRVAVRSSDPRVAAVAGLRGDILLLGEVKLTKEGQVGIAGALSKLGWDPIWGDPQSPMEASAGAGMECKRGLVHAAWHEP